MLKEVCSRALRVCVQVCAATTAASTTTTIFVLQDMQDMQWPIQHHKQLSW